MNAVVFYSNTGESKAVAAYLADRLEYPLADIGFVDGKQDVYDFIISLE